MSWEIGFKLTSDYDSAGGECVWGKRAGFGVRQSGEEHHARWSPVLCPLVLPRAGMGIRNVSFDNV